MTGVVDEVFVMANSASYPQRDMKRVPAKVQ